MVNNQNQITTSNTNSWVPVSGSNDVASNVLSLVDHGMNTRDMQRAHAEELIEDMVIANNGIRIERAAIKNPDLFRLIAACYALVLLQWEENPVKIGWDIPTPDHIDLMISTIETFLTETNDNRTRTFIQDGAWALQKILAINNSNTPINWQRIKSEAVKASETLTKRAA